MKIILALLIAGLDLSAHAGILAGPVTNPANGHTYYLLSQNTWSNAEAEAVNLGGHLATIRNAGEQEWVFSTFSAYGGALWIGLTDRDKTCPSLIRRESTRKDSTEYRSCNDNT